MDGGIPVTSAVAIGAPETIDKCDGIGPRPLVKTGFRPLAREAVFADAGGTRKAYPRSRDNETWKWTDDSPSYIYSKWPTLLYKTNLQTYGPRLGQTPALGPSPGCRRAACLQFTKTNGGRCLYPSWKRAETSLPAHPDDMGIIIAYFDVTGQTTHLADWTTTEISISEDAEGPVHHVTATPSSTGSRPSDMVTHFLAL